MLTNELVSESFSLEGMGCAACADTIEKAISKLVGVEECHVNYALADAYVTYDDNLTNTNTIEEAFSKAGYQAHLIKDNNLALDQEEEANQEKERELQQKFIVGAMISLFLVITSLPMMTGIEIPFIPMWLGHLD